MAVMKGYIFRLERLVNCQPVGFSLVVNATNKKK